MPKMADGNACFQGMSRCGNNRKRVLSLAYFPVWTWAVRIFHGGRPHRHGAMHIYGTALRLGHINILFGAMATDRCRDKGRLGKGRQQRQHQENAYICDNSLHGIPFSFTSFPVPRRGTYGQEK
jgi:hypothetical protein